MLTEAEAQPNNKQQIKHCSVLVLVVTITPYLIQPPINYIWTVPLLLVLHIQII